MQKFIYFFIICLAFTQATYSQFTANYGSNTEAGKYYNIRGIKMYCEIYGQGMPLLMIHGNSGSISSFENNIPYFEKKYKVIAVDSRSQGKSIDMKDSLSFEMMADDFAVLLDTLHIKSAYVLGWSDGAINALLLAIRHPEKVIKLVATGANLWPDSTALMPSVWKDMQHQYQTSVNKKLTTEKEKNDWKLFLLDYDQPHIPLSALHKIKCPSLIVCGDHDLIPVQHTKLIAANIPNAVFWLVPNSGHATLIEHKDEFDKRADAFFSGSPVSQ